ncbi:hypothetical protein [Marinomonas gallaica]|uniref:hypothetical protein n=1 Tax=Marinomonas gallaica TaxID=1806667 RepID=UPI003A901BFF
MHLLAQIAEEINKKANEYDVGKLQSIRKQIGGLSRLPSSQLFDQRTVFEEWGWHYGGRKELQFNIGIEGDNLRYGVAFSLECSQSLPSIDVLIPKIALFNEYLAEYGEQFTDLIMWHYQDGRSNDYIPSSIPQELVREGVFIFLGGKQNKDCVNYPLVLETLDRLLPLYLSTEKAGNQVYATTQDHSFEFKSGCSIKVSSTSGSIAEKDLNILLRHNDLQYRLYKELSEIYGKKNVGAEVNVNGSSIDLVVKREDEYWFYEIKTASTVKACIRQALGQIMEYSYWPGHQQATKLVIAGEPMPTEEESKYLDFLREEFDIPIEYREINA